MEVVRKTGEGGGSENLQEGASEQRLTFAHVAGFVVVAELQGLVDAGGGSAGDCSSEQT